MKHILLLILTVVSTGSFSQTEVLKKKQLIAEQKSNDFVYGANELASENEFVSAEMEYRKAISESPSTVAGVYNLGNSYYKKGIYEEALHRHQQAAKNATSRGEKHKAFHNIGNILMQNKKCKEAVEAYKDALRNDPKDDESRYNLALAKDCAKQQGDGDGDDDKEDDDKKDKNKDQNENEDKDDKQDKDENEKDEEGEDDDKPQDEGDQEKQDGDKDEDKDGKPQDDKKDKQGEGDKKEQEKPQPKPGQLSPQQVKNLLEAMSDQEQKVQEKINAQKQKGVKIKTDKDW